MKENNIISAIKIKINEDIAKLGNGITNNKLMMENIVKLAILLPIIFPNTKSFFPYLNKDIKQATISGKDVLKAKKILPTRALESPTCSIILRPVIVIPSAANHIATGPKTKQMIIKKFDKLLSILAESLEFAEK